MAWAKIEYANFWKVDRMNLKMCIWDSNLSHAWGNKMYVQGVQSFNKMIASLEIDMGRMYIL